MLASEKGHKEVVETLVKGGAHLNLKNNVRWLIDHFFIICGPHLFPLLIPFLFQQFGYTALILAAEKGHKAVVEILCENGADKSIGNKVSARCADCDSCSIAVLIV